MERKAAGATDRRKCEAGEDRGRNSEAGVRRRDAGANSRRDEDRGAEKRGNSSDCGRYEDNERDGAGATTLLRPLV